MTEKMTWEEYLDLNFETRNASLVDGAVVVNPPDAAHAFVIAGLISLFHTWVEMAPGRGAVSTQQPVEVACDRGYQPDFAWWPQDQCPSPDAPYELEGLPRLVVEVASPSTRPLVFLRKREDYERIGIAEVWFVDPAAKSVLVYSRSSEGRFVENELGKDEELTSRLLEGFSLAVSELFRR